MKNSFKPFNFKSAFQLEDNSNELSTTSTTTPTTLTTTSAVQNDIYVEESLPKQNYEYEIEIEYKRLCNIDKKLNFLIVLTIILLIIVILQNKKINSMNKF